MKTEKEIAAYNVIRKEYQALGPMLFGEISVLSLFVLLVVLWFTRDPGFVNGWATDVFNSKAELVSRAILCLTDFPCIKKMCYVHIMLLTLKKPPIYSYCLTIRYVTDATVAIFIAVLLFVLPSKPPCFCSWRTHSSATSKQHTQKILDCMLCMY